MTMLPLGASPLILKPVGSMQSKTTLVGLLTRHTSGAQNDLKSPWVGCPCGCSRFFEQCVSQNGRILAQIDGPNWWSTWYPLNILRQLSL